MKSSSIEVREGTEGPHHDPYSYTDTILTKQNGAWAIIHEGISAYALIYFRRGRKRRQVNLYEDPVLRARSETLLVKAVGMTSKQIKRIARKASEVPYRQHKGHGGYEWSQGHPGEMLCFCKCGAVIDSHFNRSAIE